MGLHADIQRYSSHLRKSLLVQPTVTHLIFTFLSDDFTFYSRVEVSEDFTFYLRVEVSEDFIFYSRVGVSEDFNFYSRVEVSEDFTFYSRVEVIHFNNEFN